MEALELRALLSGSSFSSLISPVALVANSADSQPTIVQPICINGNLPVMGRTAAPWSLAAMPAVKRR